MTDATHPDSDDLVALALGRFDGDQERLTEHLAGCTACRQEYDEYAGSIALVLPASPRTAPPADFQVRVLDRLQRAAAGTGAPTERHADVPDGGDAAHGGSAATRQGGSVDRPQRRRRWLLPAAAAVVGVALGAGAVTWYPGNDEAPPAASEQWQATLFTADGHDVGRIARSYGDDGPLLVLEVTDGPVGQQYICRLLLADGSAVDVAEWVLADDRPNLWVIDGGSDVVEVQLVTPEGRVWSTAKL